MFAAAATARHVLPQGLWSVPVLAMSLDGRRTLLKSPAIMCAAPPRCSGSWPKNRLRSRLELVAGTYTPVTWSSSPCQSWSVTRSARPHADAVAVVWQSVSVASKTTPTCCPCRGLACRQAQVRTCIVVVSGCPLQLNEDRDGRTPHEGSEGVVALEQWSELGCRTAALPSAHVERGHPECSWGGGGCSLR